MNIPVITDISSYTRLALDVRGSLKARISLEQSKQVLSRRLLNREDNFLSVVQEGIYGNPRSPYLELLKMAGCEFGDIQAMVNKDGLETTLHRLLDDGVYISLEEFKGKRDVVRGPNRFSFKETDLGNPLLTGHYEVRSSGSRSSGTRMKFPLRHRLDAVPHYALERSMHNSLDVPMALWFPELPAASGIFALLMQCWIDRPVARWFSPLTEGQTGALLQHRLATRYIVYGGRLWGARLAAPEHVKLTEAVKVARWMAETKSEFGGCSLTTMVSLGAKVCQAALEHGLNIEGAHIFVSGEPLSEAKRQQMEAAGVSVVPSYWTTEVGLIGSSCPEAHATDDVHLFQDTMALIQHERKVEHSDISVNAFLFTSLLASAPMILLNVESGDYGVVETRDCNCLFDELGFKTHLYRIRSFAKLTGCGMTMIGSDFVRILEEVLPKKYGGAPTDYQLVEEENSQGQTCYSLVISPSVGEIDEGHVIDTVFCELRKGTPGGKTATGFWSQVETLQVKRMNPIASSGKVLTLHLLKK